MRLKWIELNQFCRFEHARYKFGYGVTGIVGPNYVGKSSLLAAIAGSLTGDFGKPKERCINREASADEPSNVQACWDIAGQDVVIFRDMRTSKATLTSGQEVIKSVGAVQERLRAMLGVAESVIADYVFVPQDQLYGFLSNSVTERVETFASLCGVSRAEKIHKFLGEEMSKFHRFDIDETQIDQLHASYKTTAKTVERLSKELAAIKPKFKTAEELDRQQDLLLKADRIANTEVELQTAKDAVVLLDSEPTVADPKDLTEELARVASQIESIQKTLVRVSELELVAQELGEEPQFTADPRLELHSRKTLDKRRVSISAAIEKADRLLRLHEKGVDRCPTCDSEVRCTPQMLASLKTTLTEQQVRLQKVERLFAKVTAYRVGKRDYEGQCQRYSRAAARLAALKAKYPRAAETTVVDVQKELWRLHSLNRELTKQQRLQQEAAKQSVRRSQTRKLLVDRVNKLTLELSARQKELAAGKAAAKVVTISESQLSADRTTHVLYLTQLEKKRAAVSELKRIRAEIDEQEVRRKKFEKFNKFATELTEARQLCHYSKLPQKIIHRLLQSVQRLTNEQLVKLAAGCQIVINENLAFQAVYAGGVTEPAKELSFGQKVLLALAFRFSLGKLFAKSCDISILDEPTVFLDKEHLAMFSDLLKDLHIALRQQQRQLLIVTHEDTVLSSLPQVYELTHG